MANLTDMPNIGPHAAEQLAQVGIVTPEDLMAAGAERAWLKVQAIDPGVCLHMLYGLEGAVHPEEGARPRPQAGAQGVHGREQAGVGDAPRKICPRPQERRATAGSPRSARRGAGRSAAGVAGASVETSC